MVRKEMEKKEHIISVLVHNKPDVLARIAGVLGGKGYNIESLCVNTTMQYEISKIVMTTIGSKETISRIEGQLRRLVDVIQVDDLTNVESIHRELIMVRLNLTPDRKEQIKKAIDTNKWKVLVSGDTYVILEITGDKSQIDFALARLEPLGIADITRTGIVALNLEN
jgi:acetolactate synthase-1/3 small subunit